MGAAQPIWRVHIVTEEPPGIKPRALGEREGFLYIDPEIANRVLDLDMTQKDLDTRNLPVAL